MGNSISDGLKKIVDIVLDPVEALIEFAVDEIIDPIVTAIGDTIDYALDNPIEAIALITAAVLTGPGGLSAMQGAMIVGAGKGTQTLVDGGSLEDAVKDAVVAGATSFAGAKVGSYVAPTVNTATAATFSNPRLASTVATAVTKGTESATKTFIQTGDLDAAAKAFATSAAVVGATDAIDVGVDYANEQLGISDAADQIMGNVGQELETSGVLESLGLDSINELSDGIKDSLKAGIVAEITGQDVSSAMLGAATDEIFNAIGSADFVQDYIGDEGFISGVVDKYTLVAEHMQGVADNFKTAAGESLTEQQLKVVTDATSAAWDVAKRGNPELAGETFFGKDGLAKNAYDYVEDLLTDPLNSALDSITGNYDASVEAATALNNANIEYAEASGIVKYNYDMYTQFADYSAELVADRTAATARFNANKTQANADVVNNLNKAIAANNDELTKYGTLLAADHPTVQRMNAAKDILGNSSSVGEDGVKIEATGLVKEYEDVLQYIQTDYEDLDAAQVKMDNAAIQAAVETMVPTFSSQDHKSFYGLEDDADVYRHYLEDGQNGPTTKDEGEAALDAIRLSTVKSALAAKGIPLEAASPAQLAKYLAYADQEIKSVANLVGLDTERFADDMIYSAELSPEVVKAAKDAGFVPETLDFSEDSSYLGASRFEDSYGMFLTGEYIRVEQAGNAGDAPEFLDTRGLTDENIDQWLFTRGYTLNDVTHVGDGYYIRSDIESPIEKASLAELTNAVNTWADPDLEADVGARVLDTVELGVDVEVEDLLNGNVTLVNDRGVLSWELLDYQQEAIGENTNLTNIVDTVNTNIDVSSSDFTNQYGAKNYDTFVFNSEYMETGEDGVRRFTSVPPFASSISQDGTEAYNAQGQLIGVIEPNQLMLNTLTGLSDEQGKSFDSLTNSNWHKAVVNFYQRIRDDLSTDERKETWDNISSVILKATGQQIDAIAGFETLKKEAPDTNFSAYADYILSAATDLQSDEWKANAPKIEALKMGPLNRWYEANPGETPNALDTAAMYLEGVYEAQQKYPTQALSEIAVEVVQEIPMLAAAKIAQLGTKSLMFAASKQTAEKLGSAVGMTTAMALNVAEAAGGTANSTYDTVYAARLRNLGVTSDTATAEQKEIAHVEAATAGQEAGITAAATTAVLFLGPGSALDSTVLGVGKSATTKSLLNQFGSNVLDLAGVILSEGVAESIEEILPQLVTDKYLRNIDPNYVRGYDNVARAGVDALIVGGATSGVLGSSSLVNLTLPVAEATIAAGNVLHAVAGGATSTGNAIADTIATMSIEVRDLFKNTSTAEEATAGLQELGIVDTTVLNNVLNTTYDTMYVSTNEVKSSFSNVNSNYTPSQTEIDSIVNSNPNTALDAAVEELIDPKFLDTNEAKAAALAEGITLTDEQAAAYQGQKDEAAAIAEIQVEYDPQGTTREEAIAGFQAQNNYTPNEDELAQFTGAVRDDDLSDLLFGYTDGRQVTEAEARKFYEDQGYTPTDEEVANLVGQGESDFQATTKTNADAYVDPRQVTSDEARKYFTDLGYNPTDEQVANFVAQVAETEQSDIISKYVDPRQVTRSELENIANEEGLTLTDALAAAYVGQGEAETFSADTLAAARTEYDPLATTVEEATQFFADTGYTATPEEIANFVTSKAETVQQNAIGEYINPRQVTEAEATKFLSDIGYNATSDEIASFVGQTNDNTYQSTQQTAVGDYVGPRMVTADEVLAEYTRLGMTDPAEEDINKFVGQFDQTTKIAEVEPYLPTARYNALSAKIDTNEAAGLTRDQATQEALDTLTQELGTTETELLLEIGTTKEELAEDISQVSEDVGELADILGTEGVEDNPDTDVDESVDPTGLYAKIAANEAAGLTRDQATQEALDTLTQELGTTETELLLEIGTTKEELAEDISQVSKNLGGDINSIAEVLGKPTRDVTQEDVDFIANNIALNQVLTDQQITQYDVNSDGVVDQFDNDLLLQRLGGDTDVQLADTSMFTPATGLYAELDAQNNLITQLQTDAETQNNQQLEAQRDAQIDFNTQIDTLGKRTNFNQFQDMLTGANDLSGQQVSVKSGDKVNLDYLYNFESVFANPQQEALFGSPYGPASTANPRGGSFAQGGQIEDKNDMLLRILGEV